MFLYNLIFFSTTFCFTMEETYSFEKVCNSNNIEDILKTYTFNVNKKTILSFINKKRTRVYLMTSQTYGAKLSISKYNQIIAEYKECSNKSTTT